MKHHFLLFAVLAILAVGCTREDDIRPIYGDTSSEENLGQENYCAIGNDTIHFSSVISFLKREKNYFFYVSDTQMAVWLMPEDTDIPCEVYYGNDTLKFSCNYHTRQLGDMTEIIADGTKIGDTNCRIKLCYRGTVIDMNQVTGKGFITKDHDTMAVTQLSYRSTPVSSYYEICDATGTETYSNGRVRIFGDLHSGSYELANNSEIKVCYNIGVAGFCPGEQSFQINKGVLQFSDNNGRYSIIIDGETELFKFSLKYEGSCFNATMLSTWW